MYKYVHGIIEKGVPTWRGVEMNEETRARWENYLPSKGMKNKVMEGSRGHMELSGEP